MRLGWLLAGVLAVLAATAAGAAPLEVYGQLPSLDDFTISPDGKNLAYVTNVDGKRTVLINAIDAGKVIAGVTIDDQKLRDLTWADNDHLLITLSVTHTAIGATGTRSEFFMTQSYSLSTHKSEILLQHGDYQMNVVLGVPQTRTVDGHSIAFVTGVTFVNQSGIAALFTVDLATGWNKIVEKGSSQHATKWIVDEAGNIVARTEYDEDLKIWTLQIKHGAGYTNAERVEAAIETPSVLGLTPDGKSIIVLGPGNGVTLTKQFSLADNSEQTPPPGLDDGYIAPVEDPATHRLIGVRRLGVATQYTFFDPADQAAWDGLARAFPGENVGLVSWSADRKKVVVRVDGRRDGSAFFLIDRGTHQASFLGAAYGGIDVADVADVKLISYTAADGTRIPAYLTLPNGRAAKDLPLVVLPHGGPAARDTPEFDWLSQALASRGYAVLQPEFRGSDGYGWTFLSAGFGQWGRKMQTDLSDGVRYLASQGTIDPKRVCIVGASYGGYAALAGATLDPGVYRCAVSDSGLSDLHDFLLWDRDREHTADSNTLRFWTRFMGADNIDDPRLAEVSPLHHVAGVSIPILLIHGKDDTVVPIEQSEEMEAALTAAGKPVTFIKLDGEDHWLSKAETRLQMLKATVAFLEANNPPN